MANFQRVRNDFLLSLPPAERQLFSSFPSSGQMLDEIRQWDVIQRKQFTGAKLFSNIKKFSDGIQPYFDIVGLVVSSHPECAALAWGGLRLVLKLASNFTSFFEKLTDVLERLSIELPVYEQYVNIRQVNPSPRLKNALQSIYSDLFAFFSTLVRIFSKRDGAAKNKILVSGKLCWKPFDSFFEDTLQRFHMHANLFKDEILLEQFRLASDVEQAVHQQRTKAVEDRLAFHDASLEATKFQDTTVESLRSLEKVAEAESFLRIQHWISPPDFAGEFEKLLEMRTEGTSIWLPNTRQFKSWFSEHHKAALESKAFGSNVLWIRGNPGCGKSVLAAATIETLQQIHAHTHHVALEVYFFFFRYGPLGLSTGLSAYRALLAQILQRHKNDHDLIDKFIFMMLENPHGQLQASRSTLRELLKICLYWLGDSMLVLDGMDECDDVDSFVTDLIIQLAAPGVKLAAFSRPTLRIFLESVPETQQLSVGRSTSQDINLYLSRSLSDLVTQGLLPKGSDINELALRLTNAADGMFLWAHLMVKYLGSYALTPKKRYKTIVTILHPEGLEVMYNRIADLIYRGPSAERILAKRTIAWLSHCRRVMSLAELQGALAVHEGEVLDATPEQQLLFGRALLTSCAGLIERELRYSHSHKSNIVTFRFMHLSVMEFFSERAPVSQQGPEIKSAASKYLVCKESDAHVQITWTCLQYLTYFVPAQPLGGERGARTNPSHLATVFPFLMYAALNWIQHIEPTLSGFRTQAGEVDAVTESYPVLPALAAFLHKRFVLMAWIESTYTFGEVPYWETLRQWSQALLALCEKSNDPQSDSKALLKDAHEFSDYLENLDVYWTRKLMQSPECLWEEVVAFTPSRFLPHSESAIVESVACAPSGQRELSTRWLTRISETSPTCTSMFVLTVWPSRFYEITAAKEEYPSTRSMFRLCSDWKAYYEIFGITQDGKATLRHRVSIPLDAKEIKTQISQSLWFDPKADPNYFTWKMQFPLAIAAGGKTFSILRTIYRLRPSNFMETPSYNAVLLPTETSAVLASAWAKYEANAGCEPCSLAESATFRSQGNLGIHVYWIIFSDDSKHIFYSDQSLGAPRNIALFVVTLSDRKQLEVGLLNDASLIQYKGPGTENLESLRIAFHPHYPAVAFAFLDAVYLWAFGGGSYDKPEILYTSGTVGDLKFSHEADSLVIFLVGAVVPVVLQLPRELKVLGHLHHRMRETMSLAHVDLDGLERAFMPSCMTVSEWGEEENRSEASDAQPVQNISSRTSLNSPKYPSGLIRGSYSSTTRDMDSLGWRSAVADGSLDLHLWAISPNVYSSDTLELSKLPEWPGLATASFSFKLPQWDNPLITVVMNKHAHQWSDISTSVDEHLPAILLRQPDKIAKSRRLKELHSLDSYNMPLPFLSKSSEKSPKDFHLLSGHHYVSLRAGMRAVRTLFAPSLPQESMNRKLCNTRWLASDFAYQVPRDCPCPTWVDGHWVTLSQSARTQLTSDGTRHHIKVAVARQFKMMNRYHPVPASATLGLEVYHGDSASSWNLLSRWTSISDGENWNAPFDDFEAITRIATRGIPLSGSQTYRAILLLMAYGEVENITRIATLANLLSASQRESAILLFAGMILNTYLESGLILLLAGMILGIYIERLRSRAGEV